MKSPKFISRMSLSQTVLLTFATLLCFFIGTFILLPPNEIVFHEVSYSPRRVTDSILVAFEDGRLPLPSAYNDSEQQIIKEEITYRRYLLHHLPDSLATKMLTDNQLFVTADSFSTRSLIRFNYGDSVSMAKMIAKQKNKQPVKKRSRTKVYWSYYFNYSYKYKKEITPYHLQHYVRMDVHNYEQNVDFFTKYPSFLLWAILMIVQYGLFPVLTFCAWVIVIDFKKRFKEIYSRKRLTLKYTILSGTILAIFAVIGFYSFFNPNLIRSGLFHARMSSIMESLAILTCLAGNACFTGFMLISGSSFKVQEEDRVTDHDIELLNEMNLLFTRLIVIASLVLCIIVLTGGVLYNSLNKMDFIKKVTRDIGYSPLGYHYPLLFAGLCSIILLLFFIPAKMRLITIEERLRKINPTETRISQSADLAGVTRSIIVVGLPLITGFIQSILGALTH